jgi:hypothetical protein
MAVKAGRRLYINGDRSKVVENGDPEAVALYATATTDLFDRDIIRYGIVPGPTPPSDKSDSEDDRDESSDESQDADDGSNDEGTADASDAGISEARDGTEAREGDGSDEAATDDENVDSTTVVATAGARRGRRPA